MRLAADTSHIVGPVLVLLVRAHGTVAVTILSGYRHGIVPLGPPRGIVTQTPEVQATSLLSLADNDAETYTYADVFGETTFGDNGGNPQTLVPTTRMSSLTLDELNALKTEWSLPENIDLNTVDSTRLQTRCHYLCGSL